MSSTASGLTLKTERGRGRSSRCFAPLRVCARARMRLTSLVVDGLAACARRRPPPAMRGTPVTPLDARGAHSDCRWSGPMTLLGVSPGRGSLLPLLLVLLLHVEFTSAGGVVLSGTFRLPNGTLSEAALLVKEGGSSVRAATDVCDRAALRKSCALAWWSAPPSDCLSGARGRMRACHRASRFITSRYTCRYITRARRETSEVVPN